MEWNGTKQRLCLPNENRCGSVNAQLVILLRLAPLKLGLRQYIAIQMCILLLGCVTLGAQRPIVIKLSRERSVGRSVCPVHCGKMADRIRMPFGIVGRTGPGMRQVEGFGDRSTGRALNNL